MSVTITLRRLASRRAAASATLRAPAGRAERASLHSPHAPCQPPPPLPPSIDHHPGAPARSAPRGGPPCARAWRGSWSAAPPAGPQCSSRGSAGRGRDQDRRTEDENKAAYLTSDRGGVHAHAGSAHGAARRRTAQYGGAGLRGGDAARSHTTPAASVSQSQVAAPTSRAHLLRLLLVDRLHQHALVLVHVTLDLRASERAQKDG